MVKEKVKAEGSAGDSEGTGEGMAKGWVGVFGGGDWYMKVSKADDTGSGNGQAYSGPCTVKSQTP